jgi:hypothetical protein
MMPFGIQYPLRQISPNAYTHTTAPSGSGTLHTINWASFDKVDNRVLATCEVTVTKNANGTTSLHLIVFYKVYDVNNVLRTTPNQTTDILVGVKSGGVTPVTIGGIVYKIKSLSPNPFSGITNEASLVNKMLAVKGLQT